MNQNRVAIQLVQTSAFIVWCWAWGGVLRMLLRWDLEQSALLVSVASMTAIFLTICAVKLHLARRDRAQVLGVGGTLFLVHIASFAHDYVVKAAAPSTATWTSSACQCIALWVVAKAATRPTCR
jgi:hypothetical protein